MTNEIAIQKEKEYEEQLQYTDSKAQQNYLYRLKRQSVVQDQNLIKSLSKEGCFIQLILLLQKQENNYLVEVQKMIVRQKQKHQQYGDSSWLHFKKGLLITFASLIILRELLLTKIIVDIVFPKFNAFYRKLLELGFVPYSEGQYRRQMEQLQKGKPKNIDQIQIFKFVSQELIHIDDKINQKLMNEVSGLVFSNGKCSMIGLQSPTIMLVKYIQKKQDKINTNCFLVQKIKCFLEKKRKTKNNLSIMDQEKITLHQLIAQNFYQRLIQAYGKEQEKKILQAIQQKSVNYRIVILGINEFMNKNRNTAKSHILKKNIFDHIQKYQDKLQKLQTLKQNLQFIACQQQSIKQLKLRYTQKQYQKSFRINCLENQLQLSILADFLYFIQLLPLEKTQSNGFKVKIKNIQINDNYNLIQFLTKQFLPNFPNKIQTFQQFLQILAQIQSEEILLSTETQSQKSLKIQQSPQGSTNISPIKEKKQEKKQDPNSSEISINRTIQSKKTFSILQKKSSIKKNMINNDFLFEQKKKLHEFMVPGISEQSSSSSEQYIEDKQI